MDHYDLDSHYLIYKKAQALGPIVTPTIDVSPEPQDKSALETFAGMAGVPGQIEAEQKALAEVGGAAMKGLISAGIGTIPDLVGLATGLLNMLSVDPEEKGNYQQFAEGFNTVPFTTDKINQILTNLGWKEYEGDIPQVSQKGAEFVAPTKVAETVVKTGAKMLKKKKAKK